MEVCEVCGAFLIIGDAQTRVDDHLQGKQHMGYAKIKSTIEELKVCTQHMLLRLACMLFTSCCLIVVERYWHILAVTKDYTSVFLTPQHFSYGGRPFIFLFNRTISFYDKVLSSCVSLLLLKSSSLRNVGRFLSKFHSLQSHALPQLAKCIVTQFPCRYRTKRRQKVIRKEKS